MKIVVEITLYLYLMSFSYNTYLEQLLPHKSLKRNYFTMNYGINEILLLLQMFSEEKHICSQLFYSFLTGWMVTV
jgi:hypothetical protein